MIYKTINHRAIKTIFVTASTWRKSDKVFVIYEKFKWRADIEREHNDLVEQSKYTRT